MSRTRSIMTLAEYGKKELNPRWIKLLTTFSPYEGVRVSVCRKEFSGWTDEHGHKFNRPTLCQRRNVCPVCAMVYTGIQAGEATELVSKIAYATDGRVGFVSADFTLPKEGQMRVNEGDLGKLRRLCWEVLQETFGTYDEKGKLRRLIAGVGASQYWHSEDPFRCWFPHWHFTVLDVYYDVQDGTWGRNKMYLEPDQLKAFRELWRSKFEAVYGKTMAKNWNIHWRYSHGQGRLNHRLAYSFRKAVTDCYKATYKSSTEVRPDNAWLERLLDPPKNWKGVQWYGFLSDGVKSRFLKKLDIDFERQAVKDRNRRKAACPICGSDLYCYRYGIDYDSLLKEEGSQVLAFRKVKRVGA